MSIVISVIVLILSMLIFAFLQITPSTFTIFYHFALGRFSRKKADDLSLSFILGNEIFMTVLWLSIYTIIFVIFCNLYSPNPAVIYFILAGIMFALSLISLCFYFRKGKNITTTFISRKLARGLLNRAKNVKNRTDACFLGFFVSIPELFFTFPLIISSAIILQNTGAISSALTIILNIVAISIPLFIIRILYRTDRNFAEIQRIRIKLKKHFRIILALAYLALAIALANLGVINHG